MFLVYLAAFCAAASFLSGIVVIGSGEAFQYSKRDILRGRRDAILYIWVILSSMFSIAHFASLVDFGITYDWGYRSADTGRWMVIHSCIGLLLTSAHVFLHQDLRGGASGRTYLWGSRRA